MHRVALLYNPASGQHPERRSKDIAAVLAVLREAGVEVEAITTGSAESAGMKTLEAVERGCDTILACGGDGTVHAAMQSLVGKTAALGVIPMGTANALAADLGVPGDPVSAAKKMLAATPVQVPVGRVFYRDHDGAPQSCYFIVAAGIGADALFLTRLDARLKQRFGYALYVVEAFRLWATHSFPMFAASFLEDEEKAPRVVQASQLLAVRISDFGGLLHNLVPGAALKNNHLRVIAFKTRSRYRYMRFMFAVLAARHTFGRTVELVKAVQVDCTDLPGSTARLYVEADGELLGTLPAKIEVVPQALTLLIPPRPPKRGLQV
jgi:YegS/Rv2252/BmrU family lipid kinase